MSDTNTSNNAPEADGPAEVGNPITNALHRAAAKMQTAVQAVEQAAERLGEKLADMVTGDSATAADETTALPEAAPVDPAPTAADPVQVAPSDDTGATLERIESKLDKLLATAAPAAA